MGVCEDSNCILCGDAPETRNHLFVECSFSKQVWEAIRCLCGLQRGMLVWEGELNWLCSRLKWYMGQVQNQVNHLAISWDRAEFYIKFIVNFSIPHLMKEIRVKIKGYSGSRSYAAHGDQSGTGYQDFCTGDWNLAIHYPGP
ncbi:hypothetical protein GQ457_14G025190 [Hibiscus cannabinus]